MDSGLHKLYSRLDALYRDIKSICAGCQDHDCEGYVWLLKEEASLLYELGVPILEINEDINFIHSFEEAEGAILIGKPKPPCILKQDGLCFIYDFRPLVCRMYPVGPAMVNDEIQIVLFQDCKFSRDLGRKSKNKFLSQVIQALEEAPSKLLFEVADTYRKVDTVSAFPQGPNIFEVITPLRSIDGERR